MQKRYNYSEVKRFNEIAEILNVSFETAADLYKLVQSPIDYDAAYKHLEKLETNEHDLTETRELVSTYKEQFSTYTPTQLVTMQSIIYMTLQLEWGEDSNIYFNEQTLEVECENKQKRLKVIL